MGNQAIKDALKKVTDKDFNDGHVENLAQRLWTFDDSQANFQSIDQSIMECGADENAMFPMSYKIEQATDGAHAKFCLDRTIAAGFTSGEKKIDELRSEGKSFSSLLVISISGFIFTSIDLHFLSLLPNLGQF